LVTDAEREALARTRYAVLSAARASGVVLMLIGIWIWNGDIVRDGGLPAVGVPLFVLGALESLVLPQLLARRWRTPR
jgi:hypothetical protein